MTQGHLQASIGFRATDARYAHQYKLGSQHAPLVNKYVYKYGYIYIYKYI